MTPPKPCRPSDYYRSGHETPPVDSKGAAIDEILTDFGSKVYSLAIEHKGFDNKSPEVDEAKQQVKELFLELIERTPVFPDPHDVKMVLREKVEELI